MGLRLAGIEGVVVHTAQEARQAIADALSQKDVGILLITEKLASLCAEELSKIKQQRKVPLVVEMPDRHGTGRSPDSITRFVREAIGLKM